MVRAIRVLPQYKVYQFALPSVRRRSMQRPMRPQRVPRTQAIGQTLSAESLLLGSNERPVEIGKIRRILKSISILHIR